MYTFGIMLTCFVVLLVGYLSNTYNKLVYIEMEDDDEEEKSSENEEQNAE